MAGLLHVGAAANGRISGMWVSSSCVMRSSMPSSDVASTAIGASATMLRSTTMWPPRTLPSSHTKVAWQWTIGSPRAVLAERRVAEDQRGGAGVDRPRVVGDALAGRVGRRDAVEQLLEPAAQERHRRGLHAQQHQRLDDRVLHRAAGLQAEPEMAALVRMSVLDADRADGARVHQRAWRGAGRGACVNSVIVSPARSWRVVFPSAVRVAGGSVCGAV